MRAVLVLVGPTAVGKSKLALALARELSAEIVNADALQLYRGLDIGTAKPTREERLEIRHHLVDLLHPREPCTAANYAVAARAAIGEIAARGKLPLFVGGSGFYLLAALDGLGEVPPSDPEIRGRLRARLAEEGLAPLAAELARADPLTASRLAPTDTQRVLRALEVFHSSGEPLSTWLQRSPLGRDTVPAIRIGLTVPRALLYHRIEKRVHEMLAAGWVDEVRSLLASGVGAASPAFQAIGYRQLVAHLEGRSTLASAVAETITATRRFAKRQETWFRRDGRIHWVDAREADSARGGLRAWLAGHGVGVRE